DTLRLFDDTFELAPTIFPGVPRIFNRIYDKVKHSLRGPNTSSIASALFARAYAEKQLNLRSAGIVTHSFWDWLVLQGIREKLGGRVRIMLTGAAPISQSVLDFLRICFSCHVYEGYGLTETCSSLTVTDISDSTPNQVGAPVPGSEVKLVDVPEMNYFASGKHFNKAKGEICVRGPQVFKGYYKRLEETDEVLDSEGWFHTGDIGAWDSLGRLKIIDRKKSIFKLSQGEYVCPEKIETVLKRCETISQCFIYGSSLKSFLVAVVVPEHNNFMVWATLKQGFYHKSFPDLCKDRDIRKAFLKVLDEHGRSHGLKGFENVRGVYLESDMNAFTVEKGLLTPTFKLKRFAAREYYERVLEEMYQKLGE
ncbi:hypothetical protein HK100_003736, partial [Physocladia obscura]